MKVLNIYSSKTGNTKKIAQKIEEAALSLKHNVTTIKINKESAELNILDYDFIFIGSGVFACMPPEDMNNFLKSVGEKGMQNNEIKPNSPRRPSKYAVIYCTYGGVHTGVNEAVPCVKNIGQLFDHYGYEIIDEWYIVGAYIPKNMQKFNTNGRLGNITNRPNENDLNEAYEKTIGVLKSVNEAE